MLKLFLFVLRTKCVIQLFGKVSCIYLKEGPRYTKLSIIVAILPANDFNLNP